MKKSIAFSFAVTCLLLTVRVSGQSSTYIGGYTGAGHLSDTIILKIHGEFGLNQLETKKSYRCQATNGNFLFHFPDTRQPRYISLEYDKHPGFPLPLLNQYLIMPGDSIQLLINKDSISFSGRGAEKFQWAYRNQQKIHDYLIRRGASLFLTDTRRFCESEDSMLNDELKSLAAISKNLGEKEYAIMKADVIGSSRTGIYTVMNYSNFKIDEEGDNNEAVLLYKEKYFQTRADVSDPATLILSKSYGEYLYMKLATEQKFINRMHPIMERSFFQLLRNNTAA